MKNDALTPIPTPPALRWREFRVRFLPVLFFMTALAGVCFIWERNVSAPMFVGAVEGRNTQVSSPYTGKIVQLNVERFQVVTKGTPVAVLEPTDPRTMLAVVQSELDILRTKYGSDQTEQRIETDYEQLRMGWLQQKVDLAIAKANLQGARNDLRRQESLHQQKLVSDEVYDAAVTLEQALTAEVSERASLMADTEQGLKRLEAMGRPPQTAELADKLAKAIHAEEEKILSAIAGTEPVTLVAPMDGMVSIIHHQTGENISDGEPVLTIVGMQPEHIVAYLRQPIPFEPKVGGQVEVRTRTLQRQTSVGHINSVGAQYEPVTNVLAIARPSGMTDFGLPVEITLPPGLKVRPGEIVDLSVISQD